MANRLVHESSPYLQQHAHNPVDWYPWGEEALRRAQEEDKPILLSIGYSACHWCHVMERESFEDPEIARLMNESFVNIKVDREERPDLDAVYMQAVQAMTGRGGWPMTMFLTPEGKPFYGGTYFPPEDRPGMVGFPRLLEVVATAYGQSRHEVEHAAEQLRDRLQRMAQAPPSGSATLRQEVLQDAFANIYPQFDQRQGGLEGAPKFPQPMLYEFLLRYHHRTGNPEALSMVERTLEHMAWGGIYDQVGGGFHRYSTDEKWLVPHFEKMLYDNALLARLYLHAYQITGRPLFRKVVEETLDYVLREMTDQAGGFYSTQDADSPDGEGTYYLWRPEEVIRVLGEEEGELVCRYFDVTPSGNFEGQSILHIAKAPPDLAAELGIEETDLQSRVQQARSELLEARAQRVPPSRDDKVLTGWNGLMLRALAEATAVLGRDDYEQAAVRNASFILEHLRQGEALLRVCKDGQAKVPGYLEDYACFIDGLLALHEATFDPRWLREARTLADAMVDRFWDEDAGTFFDSSREHEELLVRPREFLDMATPCGGSVATDVLLRLGLLLGEEAFTQRARGALGGIQELIPRMATAFGNWLCALDFALSTPKEVALIGPPDDAATRALRATIFQRYLPNKVVTGWTGDGSEAPQTPLLEGKGMQDGRPTAYVCHNFVCEAPVIEAEALAQQLAV